MKISKNEHVRMKGDIPLGPINMAYARYPIQRY